MSHDHPEFNLSIRGRGFIWELVCDKEGLAREVSKEAFERGMIIETSGSKKEVLKLLPSLSITKPELKRGLGILEEAFTGVFKG